MGWKGGGERWEEKRRREDERKRKGRNLPGEVRPAQNLVESGCGPIRGRGSADSQRPGGEQGGLDRADISRAEQHIKRKEDLSQL